jgi:Phosphotransferase enzyme family
VAGLYDTVALNECDRDRVFCTRPIVKTKSFDIRRMKNPDGMWLIAKCARKPNQETRDSLRSQFLALQEVHQRTGAVLDATVPFPLYLWEDESVLIMSQIPGVPLNVLLRQKANCAVGWRQCKTLHRTGKAVGGWLKKFHSATSSPPKAHVHSDYMNEMELLYSRSRSRGISQAVLTQVREVQSRLSSAQENASVRMAASHGEFLPQNIMISKTEVGVIDFETFSSAGSVHRDLATFLAYIGLLTGKAKYSRTALLGLAQGFVDGYGNDFNLQLFQGEFLKCTLELACESNSATLSRLSTRQIEGALTKALSSIPRMPTRFDCSEEECVAALTSLLPAEISTDRA